MLGGSNHRPSTALPKTSGLTRPTAPTRPIPLNPSETINNTGLNIPHLGHRHRDDGPLPFLRQRPQTANPSVVSTTRRSSLTQVPIRRGSRRPHHHVSALRELNDEQRSDEDLVDDPVTDPMNTMTLLSSSNSITPTSAASPSSSEFRLGDLQARLSSVMQSISDKLSLAGLPPHPDVAVTEDMKSTREQDQEQPYVPSRPTLSSAHSTSSRLHPSIQSNQRSSHNIIATFQNDTDPISSPIGGNITPSSVAPTQAAAVIDLVRKTKNSTSSHLSPNITTTPTSNNLNSGTDQCKVNHLNRLAPLNWINQTGPLPSSTPSLDLAQPSSTTKSIRDSHSIHQPCMTDDDSINQSIAVSTPHQGIPTNRRATTTSSLPPSASLSATLPWASSANTSSDSSNVIVEVGTTHDSSTLPPRHRLVESMYARKTLANTFSSLVWGNGVGTQGKNSKPWRLKEEEKQKEKDEADRKMLLQLLEETKRRDEMKQNTASHNSFLHSAIGAGGSGVSQGGRGRITEGSKEKGAKNKQESNKSGNDSNEKGAKRRKREEGGSGGGEGNGDDTGMMLEMIKPLSEEEERERKLDQVAIELFIEVSIAVYKKPG